MEQQEISLTKESRKQYRQELLAVGDGKIGRDLFYHIKSRYRILYIRSPEERRVINTFKLISMSEGYDLFQWDFSRGMLDSFSMQQISSTNSDIHKDPEAVIRYIIDQSKSVNTKTKASNGSIFLLLDFHHFLDGAPVTERLMKEFSSFTSSCYIIIVSPTFVCPISLEKEFTLIDFPPPSESEIGASLDKMCEHVPARFPKALDAAKNNREEILKATTGLTITEAENAYAKSLVKTKTFDIPSILDEKKQIIRKGGILEYRNSRFSFDQIGGLEALKEWLHLRRLAFKEDARSFGLENPKGVLLIGIPGTGKSLVSDALADLYQMPLLRLDIGALFSSHVGESEENTRKAIKTAEAISPAILWVDEIEKGIGGVQSSNVTDGGVTNRVFGTLLTWMQEKTQPIFIICTANNVTSIPPEFMRAGRFDEVFFLDLPNKEQRSEVISVLLKRKHRDPKNFDLNQISDATKNYSPAEIEKCINNGLFIAYQDNKRELSTKDIVSESSKVQPLYNSRREEIEEMREWALGKDGVGARARLANSTSSTKSFAVTETGRQFDIGQSDDLMSGISDIDL